MPAPEYQESLEKIDDLVKRSKKKPIFTDMAAARKAIWPGKKLEIENHYLVKNKADGCESYGKEADGKANEDVDEAAWLNKLFHNDALEKLKGLVTSHTK